MSKAVCVSVSRSACTRGTSRMPGLLRALSESASAWRRSPESWGVSLVTSDELSSRVRAMTCWWVSAERVRVVRMAAVNPAAWSASWMASVRGMGRG